MLSIGNLSAHTHGVHAKIPSQYMGQNWHYFPQIIKYSNMSVPLAWTLIWKKTKIMNRIKKCDQ